MKKKDFRPKPGSPLIDAGEIIPGITESYKGKAPDIGAYEHGEWRWVPGYFNRIWLIPAEEGLKLLLTLPVLEKVHVEVASEKLIFTPEDWHKPRIVDTGNSSEVVVKVSKFGLEMKIDPVVLDPIWGRKFSFRTIP